MAKRKMSAAIKRKWVNALRSGKFTQGVGALRTSTKEMRSEGLEKPCFCCLGVLCEVTGTKYRAGADYFNMPSREAKQRLGLDDAVADRLAGLNDEGMSFRKIARIIEREV